MSLNSTDHESDPSAVTVEASIEDVLCGLQVGIEDCQALCTGCGQSFEEGQLITVYAYRLSDEPRWDVRRAFCDDCAPVDIECPTLGATEALARAVLAVRSCPRARTHYFTATEIEPVVVSPPSRGHSP